MDKSASLISQIRESPKGNPKWGNLWKLSKRRPVWAKIAGKMLNRVGMTITGIAIFTDTPVMGYITIGAMALGDGFLELWELSE